jgi:cell division protein FtsB
MTEVFQMLAKAALGLVSATGEAQRATQLVEFQNAVIKANALILTEQQENATLLREKRDLEDQLKKAKDWDLQKGRYQLRPVRPGIVLYALKQSQSAAEPPHYLCARCYERSERSILHQSPALRGQDGWHYACPGCQATFYAGFRTPGAPQYAEQLPG